VEQFGNNLQQQIRTDVMSTYGELVAISVLPAANNWGHMFCQGAVNNFTTGIQTMLQLPAVVQHMIAGYLTTKWDASLAQSRTPPGNEAGINLTPMANTSACMGVNSPSVQLGSAPAPSIEAPPMQRMNASPPAQTPVGMSVPIAAASPIGGPAAGVAAQLGGSPAPSMQAPPMQPMNANRPAQTPVGMSVPIAAASPIGGPAVGVAASPPMAPSSKKKQKMNQKMKLELGSRTASDCMFNSDLILVGFPRGPLQMTRADLCHTINNFTNRAECPGGGFKVNFQRSWCKEDTKDIVKQSFRCNGGCKKTEDGEDAPGCTWEVDFELTQQGWVLTRWHQDERQTLAEQADGSYKEVLERFPSQHRHKLLTSKAEVCAAFGGRQGVQDPSLREIAVAMVRAGQACKSVHNVLVSEMEARHMDSSTISYQYCYNEWFRNSPEASMLDVTDMLDYLKQRKETTGLNYEVHVDKAGFLDALFWECKGALEEWSIGLKYNVLLFDPTHGTNRHGLKLCCFVAVSQSGRTVILAVVLIEKEARWFFQWAFRCFMKTFRVPPKIIFTDRDQELAEAIAKLKEDGIWPDVVHFLCIFHIALNFYKHLHPLFAGNAKGWHVVHNFFWRMCKATDLSRTKPQGPGSWKDDSETLMALIKEHVKASVLLEHELEWLGGLLKMSHQYAYRFTWAHGQGGVNSTQRAESNQRKVKVRSPSCSDAFTTVHRHS